MDMKTVNPRCALCLGVQGTPEMSVWRFEEADDLRLPDDVIRPGMRATHRRRGRVAPGTAAALVQGWGGEYLLPLREEGVSLALRLDAGRRFLIVHGTKELSSDTESGIEEFDEPVVIPDALVRSVLLDASERADWVRRLPFRLQELGNRLLNAIRKAIAEESGYSED